MPTLPPANHHLIPGARVTLGVSLSLAVSFNFYAVFVWFVAGRLGPVAARVPYHVLLSRCILCTQVVVPDATCGLNLMQPLILIIAGFSAKRAVLPVPLNCEQSAAAVDLYNDRTAMAQPTSRTPSRPSSRNSLRASTASPGASPEDPGERSTAMCAQIETRKRLTGDPVGYKKCS